METILKNKSFEQGFILTYKDTGLAINLDLLDEITIEIIHNKTKETLLTRTLTGGTVSKIIAASGNCSIFINPSDTVNADRGQYDYIVTILYADSNFDNSTADPAQTGECFVLI